MIPTSSQRTKVVELYTHPPQDATVVCADELGPLIPRKYPDPPGWSADGHRVKEEVEYWRDPDKTWVYGGLRVSDGHAVTMCATSRNSLFYQDFLTMLEQDNPTGQIIVIADNLSSHTSVSTRDFLAQHPRVSQVFIPKNACWLNMQELVSPHEITVATQVATAQLNAKAKPWIWGRPPPPKRTYRQRFVYHL